MINLQAVIKKSLAPILTIAVLFSSFPVYAFAAYTASDGTQVSAYSSGVANSTQNSNGSYSSLATETISCSAGKLLANMVSSVISLVLGGTLKDKVKDTTKNTSTDASEAATTVGIHGTGLNSRLDAQINQEYATNDKLNIQNSAKIGQTNSAGVITNIGWDAMAYCIVNSVITYIADSTIRWANGGFNGNPAFIQNTGNFFEGIADREAGTFLSQLLLDESKGGIAICDNFKVQVGIGLSNYYANSSNFKSTSKCSLSTMTKNIKDYVNGNFSDGGWGAWFTMTQNDQNNVVGATILATDELYARISSKQNTAKLELGLNKGFLNFKQCDDPDNQKSCRTVTPGIVIQGALENDLHIKKDRLVLAQKFDQVVEAIIDSLIKKGVKEILTTSK